MVVLDTNVFISALVFGGVPRQVVEILIESGELILSPELQQELRSKIVRKFPDFLVDYEALALLLQERAIVVNLIDKKITACRDAKDNMILETAVAGGAGVIVTGDTDLLTLGEYESIAIVTPAAFISDFKRE